MRSPKFICSLLTTLALCINANARATCYEQAAAQYSLPVEVLHAIARVESGGNPSAYNRNRNGSEDIGLMQINSIWLPTLAKFGVTRDLLWEPCTNIKVGAWILATHVARHGWSWTAIGSYNAGDPRKRAIYAQRVWKQLSSLGASTSNASAELTLTAATQQIEQPGVEVIRPF